MPIKRLNLYIIYSIFIFIAGFGYSHEGKLNAKAADNKKKVALLFQIRHNLNHPEFWKSYLKDHMDLFNVYIHSDTTPDDFFFMQFKIKAHIPASWAYHVKAEVALLKRAVRNPKNCKFVLISESCLPLVNAETLYQKLTQDDSSYLYFSKPWWVGQPWRDITELPEEHRWGNQEWFVMNRKHALICVKDTQTVEYISRHPIDSESFPACVLSVNNCLHEVVNFGFTYVDWSRPCGGGANPYHFDVVNNEDLELLRYKRSQGHLFARKFTVNYPEEAIKQLIDEQP